MVKLDKNKKYLLACSYGPDSMYLFDLLLKDGYNFEVAHVNYGMREECFKETEDLKQYCLSKNIKIHVLKTTVEGKNNIESRCRNIRYDYFSSLVNFFQFDAVLIAHHLDDLIETYLIQKERNNKVVYFGLKEEIYIKNVLIKRPIIFVKKFQITEYLKKNNVPYAIDSSNLQDDFLRNKIRHQVVEKMSDDDKEKIVLEINQRNEKLKDLFEKIKNTDLDNVEQLLNLNEEEFSYAIYAKINEKIANFVISQGFCKEIRKILVSNKSNIKLHLVDNFYLIKSYGKVEVIDLVRYKPYCFVVESPTIIDNDYLYFNGLSDTSNRNIRFSDYPLTIRSIKQNDLIPVGPNMVLARRAMIDWKVPLYLRKVWPVVLNKNNEVIYCPRYQPHFKPVNGINLFIKK